MNFNEAFSELDRLYEAKRIISDVDVLYHFTNPTPLVNIINSNCLRADVNLKAVCLTTDKDYQIYGYPCGLRLSRAKLTNAGYELVPFDEFSDDPDSPGESEERVYGNIENVTSYLTAVYVNWDNISIVQSAEGDRIADAKYVVNPNNNQVEEHECYDLMLKDFTDMLARLRSKGVAIKETGTKMSDEYYLDTDGKLQYGQMLADVG